MNSTMRRLSRRQMLLATTAAVVFGAGLRPAAAAPRPQVTMYKSPYCGCCSSWGKILERAGFPVKVVKKENMVAIKMMARVPASLESCHTAFIDGLVVEGHVPISAIDKLLAERPVGVIGIAVPGMPQGSPGMSGDPEPFDVVAFGAGGLQKRYMSFR